MGRAFQRPTPDAFLTCDTPPIPPTTHPSIHPPTRPIQPHPTLRQLPQLIVLEGRDPETLLEELKDLRRKQVHPKHADTILSTVHKAKVSTGGGEGGGVGGVGGYIRGIYARSRMTSEACVSGVYTISCMAVVV